MTVEEIIKNHKEIYQDLFSFEPDFRTWSEIGAVAAIHHGANVLPEPKIMLAPTVRANLAQGSDEDRLTGAIREEFFIHHVAGADLTVNYLKSMRGQKLPDYVLFLKDRKVIVEIGGAGKTSSQFKGIDGKEKLILTQPGTKSGIPLILFGFIW